MAAALVLLGYVVMAVGGIWLLVVGFQQSILWGVAMLLTGIASLIFVISYWEDAKKSFLTSLAGVVLMVIGIAISANG